MTKAEITWCRIQQLNDILETLNDQRDLLINEWHTLKDNEDLEYAEA